ncbi:Hsp70 family protein [Pradoshia sp.]
MIKGLGIDLGTTYSCVAYVDDQGNPVVLKNADGNNTTPSVVYFESSDDVVVGEVAKQSLIAEPDNTVAFIKRDMGKIDEDTNKIIMRNIHGVELSPQEISAKILTKLVQDANKELRTLGKLDDSDADLKDVVITCPAYFGMAEKDATKSAGKIAGLNVLNIIPEPTAAALNYAFVNKDIDQTVAVYDLGGGTFDITVIEVSNGVPRVICTDGSHTLGGKDWDEVLVDFFCERYEEEKGCDISDDIEVLQDLYLKAEQTKMALSNKEKVPVSIVSEGGRLNLQIKREEFNEISHELLERTIVYMDRCLKVAACKHYNIENSELSDEQYETYVRDVLSGILLVGGSSRMPQVTDAIFKHFNKQPKMADLDEAVAKGAALCANNDFLNIRDDEWDEIKESVDEESFETIKEAVQTGNKEVIKQFESVIPAGMVQKSVSRGMIFKNVSPRTYGISTYESETSKVQYIANFIIRNDELPASRTLSFYTIDEGQTGVAIDVYESFGNENASPIEKGVNVGNGLLEFPNPMKKGTPIEVTLKMNSTGLLEVSAIHHETNSIYNGTFHVSNALSAEETNQAIERNKHQSFS